MFRKLWLRRKGREVVTYHIGDLTYTIEKPINVVLTISDFIVDGEGRTFGGRVGVFYRPEKPAPWSRSA